MKLKSVRAIIILDGFIFENGERQLDSNILHGNAKLLCKIRSTSLHCEVKFVCVTAVFNFPP